MFMVIICIDQRSVFMRSGIPCLTKIFNLSNPKMKIQYVKN